jgi:drug/metabolite transporter (DMT)-like permease
MEVSRQPSRTVYRYLVIAAILQLVWGLVPTASKFVIDEIPVELYIALRWSLSGLIFAGYLLATRSWRPITAKDFLAVAGLGILGYGFGSLGTLYGLRLGGVVNFALMGALGPIATSLVSILLLREQPHRLFWVALVVVVLGLVCLVFGKQQVSAWSIAGQSALLILGAFILEGIVFVFSNRFKERVHLPQYLALSQLSAAGFMWALQGAAFRQTDSLSNLSMKGFSAALFVSVVACVLCYAILYWLLNHIDGHRLALFDGLHTLSATLFGYLLFLEPVRPLMLVGGGLILAGMVFGNAVPQSRDAVSSSDLQ